MLKEVSGKNEGAKGIKNIEKKKDFRLFDNRIWNIKDVSDYIQGDFPKEIGHFFLWGVVFNCIFFRVLIIKGRMSSFLVMFMAFVTIIFYLLFVC